MEPNRLPKEDSTLFALAENVANNPSYTHTEQRLRRRLVRLIAQLSMRLDHADLMDLTDYLLLLSA
jgi:hypothetical protein